jgi:hypothetical protein
MQNRERVSGSVRLVDLHENFVRVLAPEDAIRYLADGIARPIGNPRQIRAIQLCPVERTEDALEFPGRALTAGAFADRPLQAGQRDTHRRETPKNPPGVWAFKDGLLRNLEALGNAGSCVLPIQGWS